MMKIKNPPLNDVALLSLIPKINPSQTLMIAESDENENLDYST
jgi:hypothetical protein